VSSLLKLLTTTPQALVLLLFLLVPGFVFIKVFDNLLPGRRRSFAQQVIDILCWSFTILAIWVLPALIVFELSQRNLSAAFIIAASNFADQPNVLVYLAATGLIGMVVILPTAAEFGKHSETAPEPQTAPGLADTSVSNQP
jgi:hypothetical protein